MQFSDDHLRKFAGPHPGTGCKNAGAQGEAGGRGVRSFHALPGAAPGGGRVAAKAAACAVRFRGEECDARHPHRL